MSWTHIADREKEREERESYCKFQGKCDKKTSSLGIQGSVVSAISQCFGFAWDA